MKILLLGATGRTGKYIIEEALKRGHLISAIARDPDKLKDYKIEITQGTPYDYDTVERAMTGCEAVINTLNVSSSTCSPKGFNIKVCIQCYQGNGKNRN
jgi:putative NADH-flavin reductase